MAINHLILVIMFKMTLFFQKKKLILKSFSLQKVFVINLNTGFKKNFHKFKFTNQIPFIKNHGIV